MLGSIFDVIGQAITNFLNTLTSVFGGVTNLFYDATANEGAGGMTVLGTLILIGAGVGIVYWGFYLIKRLATVNVK